MSKESLVTLAGIAIALMPHLGFPLAYDNIFYTVCGGAVALLGVFQYKDIVKRKARARRDQYSHSSK